MEIIWTAVLVASVILEAVTTALVAIWFVPGAILALIFAALNFPLWTQLLAFFISGLGILLRVAFREKHFRSNVQPTNADLLIGKNGIVVEPINNIKAEGAVKINGTVWSARVENADTAEVGAVVEILRIEGVKLICRIV
jgi:membrane protein implicated in regulation of membrane protease activity